MKTLQYFFFVALGTILMAADCSNKDSEFYNDVFVSSPNLVNVEVDSEVPSNPIVYVNATINRFINVPGQAHPLDIYKSTGGAAKYNFTYELEKANNGNWSVVDITDSMLTIQKGQAVSGAFVYASSVYNTGNQFYEYRVGIQSLAPGNYRLSFGYNSTSTTDVELRSESLGSNLYLNLNSPYSALDAGGYYTFTIN